MDIDGFLDFGGKLFISFELKYGDVPVPYGQRLAYEHMIDALHDGGHGALGIIARHNVGDPEEDVDAADAVVDSYRYNHKWHKPKTTITVGAAIEKTKKIFNL